MTPTRQRRARAETVASSRFLGYLLGQSMDPHLTPRAGQPGSSRGSFCSCLVVWSRSVLGPRERRGRVKPRSLRPARYRSSPPAGSPLRDRPTPLRLRAGRSPAALPRRAAPEPQADRPDQPPAPWRKPARRTRGYRVEPRSADRGDGFGTRRQQSSAAAGGADRATPPPAEQRSPGRCSARDQRRDPSSGWGALTDSYWRSKRDPLAGIRVSLTPLAGPAAAYR